MANINPLLQTIINLRHRIESGESLQAALKKSFDCENSDWSRTLKRWVIAYEHGGATDKIVCEIKSPYRRVFLETLMAGLAGTPIYQTLIELEAEVRAACEIEIEMQLKRLPFLSMLPVLFFMFPAFLLLMLGPVLIHLIVELSR